MTMQMLEPREFWVTIESVQHIKECSRIRIRIYRESKR